MSVEYAQLKRLSKALSFRCLVASCCLREGLGSGSEVVCGRFDDDDEWGCALIDLMSAKRRSLKCRFIKLHDWGEAKK